MYIYLIPNPIFDLLFLVLGVIVLVQIAQEIGTEAKSQQDFLDQLVCNFFLVVIFPLDFSFCHYLFLLIDDLTSGPVCLRKWKLQIIGIIIIQQEKQ